MSMLFVRLKKMCAAFAAVLLCTTPFQMLSAKTTASEVQIISRMLELVDSLPKPNNHIKLGVIYDPTSPASKQEMQEVQTYFNTLNDTLSFEAVPIEVQNTLHDVKDFHMVFITSNLEAKLREFSREFITQKLLTISSNLSCVELNVCIIAVHDSHVVDVYINENLARKSGVRFDPNLWLVAKRV